jgi:hypothetical protein
MKSSIQKFSEKSTNLIIPTIGYRIIPRNIWFPKARSVTIVDWNNYALYNNLNIDIFPNVEQINIIYSSQSNIPRVTPDISTRFIDNINFKWGVYEDPSWNITHSNYNKNMIDIKSEYLVNINVEHYMYYIMTATNIDYRRSWQEYMSNKMRELL